MFLLQTIVNRKESGTATLTRTKDNFLSSFLSYFVGVGGGGGAASGAHLSQTEQKTTLFHYKCLLEVWLLSSFNKMPGANCSIYGCGTNKRHKGFSIFKSPSASKHASMSKKDLEEWRTKFIGQILKGRVVDEALQKQIDAQTLRICQKHFKEECIDSSEYTL